MPLDALVPLEPVFTPRPSPSTRVNERRAGVVRPAPPVALDSQTPPCWSMSRTKDEGKQAVVTLHSVLPLGAAIMPHCPSTFDRPAPAAPLPFSTQCSYLSVCFQLPTRGTGCTPHPRPARPIPSTTPPSRFPILSLPSTPRGAFAPALLILCSAQCRRPPLAPTIPYQPSLSRACAANTSRSPRPEGRLMPKP